MFPAIMAGARAAFAYLSKYAPRLVAGAKVASSPRVWNRAIGSITAKGAVWTVKHPFLVTAMATVAMYLPDLSPEIERYWAIATGGSVTNAEEAIEYASQSPEKEALILSAFAKAGIPPGAFMQRDDGPGLDDHQAALLRQLEDLYSQGSSKKVTMAATGFADDASLAETAIEHQIGVLSVISDTFSVRSVTALLQLKNALNSFMAMSESDLRVAHRVKQL
jgi:hypothetical protein